MILITCEIAENGAIINSGWIDTNTSQENKLKKSEHELKV